MAGRIALPQQFQQLTETGQKSDNSYYRWFESVEVTLRDLDGRVTVIEAEIAADDGGLAPFLILGPASVAVLGTPAGGVVELQLVGDTASPGNIYYYGTNSAGVKGWYVNSAIVPSPNTNQNFWRGDLVWSNELEGPFSARALQDASTLGAELTTNGTFTGSAAGWTLGTDWAYVANNVAVTIGGAPGTLSQNLTIVAGQRYLVSFTLQHSVSNNAFITPSIGAAVGVQTAFNNTIVNTVSQIITAVASGSVPISFAATSITGAGTVTIDTVSVRNISSIPFTIEAENSSGAGAGEIRAYASTTNQSYGFGSGQSITTGINNVAVGTNSGSDTTTGSSNVFVGSGAGEKNTSGSGNTFIGMSAGNRSTTGTGNTYIGNQAGQNAGTGGGNTFIGSGVGQNNGIGSSNVFVGNTSGQANVSGTSNVLVGLAAGIGNTSGSNMACIGRDAGFSNTTGGSNNYFGSSSGRNNTVGQNNLFLGNNAGQFQADGVTALTDPERSVYIGNSVRGFNNTDDNTIAIGFSAIARGPNTAQWGSTAIINHYFSGSIQYTGKVFVAAKSGFPAPVAGVITLANNTNYEISGTIDLTGDRIVCGTNNAIFGQTADADGLISTGLPGGSALITSTSSLDLNSLRLSAPTGRIFDLNDGATNSLNWFGLQILATPTIGTIQNYANIVINNSIISDSANLTLTGTIASFVSEVSLWDGRAGQTTIIVPAAAVITRRFRMLYTAFVVNPGETGINFNVAATINDESYILDNVNFSGGGTYLAGLDYASNKSLFFNNVGITNTSVLCQYSMTANATATVIAVAGTFVKVAGTTVASGLNQKFSTATTQRATYTGAFPANFRAVGFASMRSGNNNTLRMRIAVNGVTQAVSNTLFQTTGAGDASAVGCQAILSLVPTDFVEVWVTNDTAANNITVSDLNFTIVRL